MKAKQRSYFSALVQWIPVMGPIGWQSTSCEFSDQVSPRFDQHGDYGWYHDNGRLGMVLTTLRAFNHRPAIVGRLHGEAKSADKTLSTEPLWKEGDVELILERLDKAYPVHSTIQ